MVGNQFGAVGVQVVKDVVAHLLIARYGDNYHTLITVAVWGNNMRKYKTALRQLKTPFERQGHTPVRGDKNQIAALFGLANTGLDNFRSNMADLLEVVEPFPSKHRSKAGLKGAVRFKQHPLETEIQTWLAVSPELVRYNGQDHPALLLSNINRYATTMGYKSTEIEQIINVMETRELCLKQAGYLLLLPQLTISMDDVTNRVEQFQQEIQLLQKLFPNATGLQKLIDKADSFAKQHQSLPSQPDETTFNLWADLDEQADWLLATKQSSLKALRGQIANQAKLLPRLSSQHEPLLTTQLVGTNRYISELNDLRLTLKKSYQQLTTRLQNLAHVLNQSPNLNEINAMPAEQLTQLVQLTRQRNHDLSELKQQVDQLNTQTTQLESWTEVAKQETLLLKQLQQNDSVAHDLLQQLQTVETEVATAFAEQTWLQLSQSHTHQQKLVAIKQQLEQVEAQASNTFTHFQRTYQQALIQQLNFTPASLWLPIVYSPINPFDVRQQVYKAVQRVILQMLVELGQETRNLINDLHNVRTSSALEFLDTTLRNHLTNQTVELTIQLSNLYDPREFEEYTSDLNLIKDFQPPTGGNFYTLIQQIAAAQQTLQDYQYQFNILQTPLQKLALSPVETDVMTGISNMHHSTTDLIEIREEFNHLKESIFWDTLRSLWQKQLLRFYIEPKSFSSNEP
jgi:hypothetical protein